MVRVIFNKGACRSKIPSKAEEFITGEGLNFRLKTGEFITELPYNIKDEAFYLD